MRISLILPWTIAVVATCTSIWLFLTTRVEHTISEFTKEMKSERFPVADGTFVRAEYVEISPSLRVNLRYSLGGDDGVEIEMFRNGRFLWNAYVERLGTAHSSYEHSVECHLYNGDLVVRSKGTVGEVYERRDLDTRVLLDREAFPVENVDHSP